MRAYFRPLSYFRRDGTLIVFLLMLHGISLAVGMLQAWPAGILADTILNPRPNQDWIHRLFAFFLSPLPQTKVAQVIGIAAIGMILKVIQDTMTMSKNMLNNQIRYNGTSRVRTDLFSKLTDLGPAYHRTHPQGDAIYRLSSDVIGFFGILDTFVSTFVSVIWPLAMISVMLSCSVKLTAISIAAAPALLLANLYFSKTIKRTTIRSKQIDTELTTVMQRSIASMSLIQLFGRQHDEIGRFDHAVDRSVRAGMKMNWQEQLYPLVVQTVFSIIGAAIFGYGGYLVYRDTFVHPVASGMTVAALIAFMAYLGQLWDPLNRLIGFKAAVQGNFIACERVFHVLDQPLTVHDLPNAKALPLKPRTLALHNVGFRYQDGDPVLRGVTAKIPHGEMVAFVGPSGTGKSTLLSLLPRLYDPTSGSLTLDGYDLRSLKLADVRRHIALVPQDSAVLAATIAENIGYGRPGATREEIQEAARMAGAAEFIEALPDGYDTLVTENGQNLSGGQRQRLAIARALLTDAPILVLDEPTSGLDGRQERLILDTLRDLKGRRTIVLVTHRLDTVAECDQIFVMSEGHIVEHGTQEELNLQRGHYFNLMQAGIAIPSPAIPSPVVPSRRPGTAKLKIPPTSPFTTVGAVLKEIHKDAEDTDEPMTQMA